MKRTTVVLWSGVVLYLLSWCLPVIDGGTSLARGGLPGWEAFRFALSPIWPFQGSGGATGILDALGAVSALTNGGFVLAVAALAAGHVRLRRVASWGLIASAGVNAMWFLMADARGELRVGYYAWWGAFIVLAGAAFLRWNGRARRTLAAATTH